MLDYEGVSAALKTVYESYGLEKTDVGQIVQLAIQKADNRAKVGLPDLSNSTRDGVRTLKKRVREAKKSGKRSYRGISIGVWSAVITQREKELGVGTRGGRPPEPL